MLDINQRRAVSVMLNANIWKILWQTVKSLAEIYSRSTKIAKNQNTRGGYHLPADNFVNECKSTLFKMFLR